MTSLHDQKAIVTGGTGALGQAVVRELLDQGARVWTTNLNAEELDRLDQDIRNHERFSVVSCDLSDEKAVTSLFEQVGEPLDILVNVAGGFAMGSVKDTSLEDWRRMHDMNLTSAFLCCREALRRMNGDKGGRIVTVGAMPATQRTGGLALYTTAKAGVINLTEAIAEETLTSKITANAILPSIMDTPGNREGMPDADFSQWAPVADVASVIRWLVSEEAWLVTGALVPVRAHT